MAMGNPLTFCFFNILFWQIILKLTLRAKIAKTKHIRTHIKQIKICICTHTLKRPFINKRKCKDINASVHFSQKKSRKINSTLKIILTFWKQCSKYIHTFVTYKHMTIKYWEYSRLIFKLNSFSTILSKYIVLTIKAFHSCLNYITDRIFSIELILI